MGYNPCCLYLFWGSSYLWFGGLFKLYVYPFNLSVSFFEHFITFWLQAILLFFWRRPGNLSFLWDLVPFHREMVFRKQGLDTTCAHCFQDANDLSISRWIHIHASNSNPTTKIHSSFSFFYICSSILGCEKPHWSIFFHSTPMSSADGPSLPTRLKKEKGKEKEGGHWVAIVYNEWI